MRIKLGKRGWILKKWNYAGNNNFSEMQKRSGLPRALKKGKKKKILCALKNQPLKVFWWHGETFDIFQDNDINYILEFYDMAIEFQTVNSMQQFWQNIKCQKTRKTSILLPFSTNFKNKLNSNRFYNWTMVLVHIETTTKIGFGKKPTLFGRWSTCQTIIKNHTWKKKHHSQIFFSSRILIASTFAPH